MKKTALLSLLALAASVNVAAAQNLVAARLYGVNPKRVYALTVGLGAVLAGVAGGL